ncbi:MAG: protein kinase domain-containing protein, partial [Pseudonocardiaceae bacterium]
LLDQPVALKRVRLVGVDGQQAELTWQRALREARVAARLRHHRHVVATYDVRVNDGDMWLVLEYLRCQSLAQILRERGPLDSGQVARIGAQVADALAAAHALGIEHRDVTPGNVLISDDGAAKLTDFGISSLAGDVQLTEPGVVIGTIAYLAPEVARTGKSSPASDVFSLGATLYAAIEGQPPSGAAGDAEQQRRIVSVGIIRPPTAAGAFTALLLRLLALDPATRPDAATARDLLEDFATQINARTLRNGGQVSGPEDSLRVDDAPTGGDVCPYPGLTAFGPAEAGWFFGRDLVTAEVVARLDERLAGGGLLAVVAASGAGKSSLLAAGVIPALARGAVSGSRVWPVVATTPGGSPLGTLLERVAEETGADPAVVAGDPDRFAAFLGEAVAIYTGKPQETQSCARIVLIIDQFEEIFTDCHEEAERRAFIAALGVAAQRAVALVVLGVRADFYGQCLAYPVLLTALQSPVAVGPMSAEQLREVITRPAEVEGWDVEPGLAELLLRDLGVDQDTGAASYDPGALPLLAHALRATWQQRDGVMLTVAGYQRTGGIRQALASTAERAHSRLSPVEQQIARQVLLRLVNISDQDGSGDTRRRLPRARLVEALPLRESADAVDTVLQILGQARLLSFDTDRDVGSVEITHEALLNAWPRLRQWIDTDRAGNLI